MCAVAEKYLAAPVGNGEPRPSSGQTAEITENPEATPTHGPARNGLPCPSKRRMNSTARPAWQPVATITLVRKRETTMNPAALIHAAALAMCFTAHLFFAHELDGVRRAMQTIQASQAAVAAQVALPVAEVGHA